MENRDKIFDQFKNAADNVAPKEFPSMESVWNRVEEKLDNKVLKKETKTWKKIAVAASILLCVSIGYQFIKTNNEIVIPDNQVVVNDKVIKIDSDVKPNSEYPNIPEEAKQKLEDVIASGNSVAYQDTQNSAVASPSPVMVPPSAIEANAPVIYESEKDLAPVKSDDKSTSGIFKTKIYDARGVKYADEVVLKKEAKQVAPKKADALYVIDGEAVADNINANAKEKLTADDIENIEVLKEPLYIINGVEYSEESLYGKNPTSPYAPLDKQEIIKTKVFQGEEAEELYGEKGKKGVVVISTKNGKPLKRL